MILVFLQSWRTALIPIIAIPVSLIGTFAVMAAFGFSLNTLTLFGLVLAIGIVVDDAIVVVENVERNIADGHVARATPPTRPWTRSARAVIAIALVLGAVFIPTAFIPGISGQFYRQFALTIAVSTFISAFISLTLSPALAAILLKPHEPRARRAIRSPRLGSGLAGGFNRGFDRLAHGYAHERRRRRPAQDHHAADLCRRCSPAPSGLAKTVPHGFIPTLDQGYAIVVVQLPDGASLSRTDAVTRRVSEIARDDARRARTPSPSPASPARPSPTPPTPARSSCRSSPSRSASRRA